MWEVPYKQPNCDPEACYRTMILRYSSAFIPSYWDANTCLAVMSLFGNIIALLQITHYTYQRYAQNQN